MKNSFDHLDHAIRLDQAARIKKATPEEILLVASKNAVELLFAVPNNLDLRLEIESLNSISAIHGPMLRPDFLALNAHQCYELYTQGRTRVAFATRGWRSHARHDLERISPENNLKGVDLVDRIDYSNANPLHRGQHWRFYSRDIPCDHIVEIGSVFISSREFEDYSNNFSPMYDPYIGLRNETHLSEKLYWMNEAAITFWGKSSVDFEDSASHPKEEEVIEFFKSHSFSKSLAKIACTLIRPEKAKKGRRDSRK